MKLGVFTNDPLEAYHRKGVLKPRYYNPDNVFDEVHIISPSDNDISEELVQETVGKAKLKIHSVGKATIINRFMKKKHILNLIKTIQPDVIRSYNPLVEGWFAAYCGKKLGIPFFLSLHIQYDGLRNLIKSKNYKKYLALKYSRKFIEPYVLSNADKITAVYRIIEPYVLDLCDRKPEILYNRVDLSQFRHGKKIKRFDRPLIISVGRLTPQKNHQCIIKAIKDLDVHLQIIGDGEQRQYLKDLVKELQIEDKVTFILTIPNSEIQDYYKSSDLFALAYDPEIEGLPIPVLEAMASGLPIVISKPVSGLSDGLEGVVSFSDIEPSSFALEIKKILEDKGYAKKLSDNALIKSKEFDGKIMEEREATIYKELLQTRK